MAIARLERKCDSVEHRRIEEIRLDLISPSPNQARQIFDEEYLVGLAESIKSQGVLQPIAVKPDEDSERFTLVFGERRVRAARMAGLKTIPAIISDSEDTQEMGVVENLQRRNLNPIEEAEALYILKNSKGYTDEDIAETLGMSRQNVGVILSLLRLPKKIKDECQHAGTASKTLLYQLVTMGSEHEMLDAWEQYKRGTLTIRECKEAKKRRESKGKRYEYKQRTDNYTLSIKFRRVNVPMKSVIAALESELEKARMELGEREPAP